MIDSGRFRNYITFERKVKTPDEGGGRSGSWEVVHANVPASLRPASAREVTVASQRQLEISHVIEIRFMSGISSEWRIKFGTRYFAILGVRDDDELRRRHLIDAIERQDKDFR